MVFPKDFKIQGRKLPKQPGVYLFKDRRGRVIYIGKASNLRVRVASYWKNADLRHSTFRAKGRIIEELIGQVRKIAYRITASALEALILEAKLIRQYLPQYNIREKDDKSFLYVVITQAQYPKVILQRGKDLSTYAQSLRVFGPYTNAGALRAALDLIRKWFPWSTCSPRQSGPCFDYHIGRCPGVCLGAITRQEYLKNIRQVILILDGKKGRVLTNLKKAMHKAAQAEHFEEAEKLRRKWFALQHLQDVAVLKREDNFTKLFKRIEGYDISNISGIAAVGSMVVFENNEPKKNAYRKFKIKTVRGINDVAMLREMLQRRFKYLDNNHWQRPDLLVIDGGLGQIKAAQEILNERGLTLPIVGIAKGFQRKQDRLIFNSGNPKLARLLVNHKGLFLRVRDEAHRFAVAYHRQRMRKNFLPSSP